jgi:hypothetical protein
MLPKHIFAVLLLFLSSLSAVHAAGEPVNEDLSLLFSLSENMLKQAKQGDVEGFTESVNRALRQASINRNNSIILPRASAKFRAAKIAVKAGNFSEGIDVVEQAQLILMKKKVLKWDGGS